MSERNYCACYKSQKEKDKPCPFLAKRGSLYCGNHQTCKVIFGDQQDKLDKPEKKIKVVYKTQQLPPQQPTKAKVVYKEPIELQQVVKPQELIVPTLANVRKKFLTDRGFKNYTDWANQPNSLYIGRYMRIGDTDGLILIPKSKWQNPFKLDKDKNNIDDILRQYEEYVRNSSLYNDLHELSGKELGCWCKGLNPCHGDVLIRLFKEKFGL